MLTSKHKFSLVTFGEDTVPPALYAQAQRVYIDSIGAVAKTNTNEIAYWKDRYNREFAAKGDKLYVYGLLKEKEVIGFALVFFFKSQNLVVVDHLAIKGPERNFGSFFYFKEMIAQSILDEGKQVDYVLAEIVTSKEGDPHPVDPQLLIQLLKQSGFKVAKLKYYTPNIREESYDTKIDAALMLYGNERGDQISKSTFLAILNCLLYELYLRWYAPHISDDNAFKHQLDSLLELYQRELAKEDFVKLNGNTYKESLVPASEKVATQENSPEIFLKPIVAFLLLGAVSAFLAITSYLSGISVYSVMFVFTISLFGLLAIFAIWHRAAGRQVDKALRLASAFLRREKDIR